MTWVIPVAGPRHEARERSGKHHPSAWRIRYSPPPRVVRAKSYTFRWARVSCVLRQAKVWPAAETRKRLTPPAAGPSAHVHKSCHYET